MTITMSFEKFLKKAKVDDVDVNDCGWMQRVIRVLGQRVRYSLFNVSFVSSFMSNFVVWYADNSSLVKVFKTGNIF